MKTGFTLLASCLLIFVSSSTDAQEVPRWKARAAYQYQDLSFTSDAHGANFLLIYNRPREWGLRGGVHYVNKFGDAAPGYDLGGTYWATKTTTFSFDAEFAPGQIVVPRQGYTLEASQVLLKTWVPSLGYKFAHYRDADAHIVMPGLTWYFYPRWDFMTKYFMSVSRFGSQSFTNHSAMARINWSLIDPIVLFAGYARANESFETGSPFGPFGCFSANHAFGGFKWEFYKRLGVDFTLDYENRNNGSTLKTYDMALFYHW
ncbi:MAG: YaiO family outer membrane beta-barrel protein [Deltaproteobacteria bacterium]|nr:YaiO family outer membrane beta-barrel protein [Deltaproteobacteria bacterium]MBI4373248.1 YaiO family outer membrane beta-barrel protein [Deltaproteobacteria bacterium]